MSKIEARTYSMLEEHEFLDPVFTAELNKDTFEPTISVSEYKQMVIKELPHLNTDKTPNLPVPELAKMVALHLFQRCRCNCTIAKTTRFNLNNLENNGTHGLNT